MKSDLLNRAYYVLQIMNYTQNELEQVIEIHYKIDFDKKKYKSMIELQVNLKGSDNGMYLKQDETSFKNTGIQSYYEFLLSNKEYIFNELANVRKENNEKRWSKTRIN